MVAPTERQAYELFSKTLNYLLDNHRFLIKRGKDRPTKHIINLVNGTKILCLPCGLDGTNIRGLTCDRVYVDECSRVPDEVFDAITPMLLTTAGSLILLSTPFGRKGFFYNRWSDEDNDYTKFYETSEKIMRNRPICESWTEEQRDKALQHLENEKKDKSSLAYSQEYEALFMEELRQLIPDSLIRKCMVATRPDTIAPNNYVLGVDIARMGQDSSAFSIFKVVNPKLMVQVESFTTEKTLLSQTTDEIINLDRFYDFHRIFVDDEGIGVGVADELRTTDQTKRKTIGINNSKRMIDKKGNRTKRLQKEDLYMNLLKHMERDQVQLLQDAEIFQSLKGIQFEYCNSQRGEPMMKIMGIKGKGGDHLAESIVRCVWVSQGKGLNIWISSFGV
jgi:hypothetical protein